MWTKTIIGEIRSSSNVMCRQNWWSMFRQPHSIYLNNKFGAVPVIAVSKRVSFFNLYFRPTCQSDTDRQILVPTSRVFADSFSFFKLLLPIHHGIT